MLSLIGRRHRFYFCSGLRRPYAILQLFFWSKSAPMRLPFCYSNCALFSVPAYANHSDERYINLELYGVCIQLQTPPFQPSGARTDDIHLAELALPSRCYSEISTIPSAGHIGEFGSSIQRGTELLYRDALSGSGRSIQWKYSEGVVITFDAKLSRFI